MVVIEIRVQVQEAMKDEQVRVIILDILTQTIIILIIIDVHLYDLILRVLCHQLEIRKF
jgi:hypothetical protein